MKGAKAWQLPDTEIWQVAYSPSGEYLAIVGSAGVLIYQASTLELHAVIPRESGIHTVAWSPDGTLLASASKDGKAEIWDWNTEERLALVVDSYYWISIIEWSPNGKRLAAVVTEGVQVWNITTEGGKSIFSTGMSSSSIAWSPDGSRLAIGEGGATVRIWDTTTWEQLADLRGTGRHESQSFWTVQILSWSPDGKWLAGGLEEGSVLVWDQTTGEVLTTLPLQLQHTQSLGSLVWSPDGRWLASAAYDWIGRVWDVSTGKELITFDELGKVSSITWPPDGKHLTIGTMEGTLIMLDMSQLPF